MAWNEPGKGKDPWGGGNRNKGSGGPPDLDQIWRRFRDRFANRGGGGNGNGTSPSGSGGPGGGLIAGLVVIAALVWLATGMYIVQPGEQGVLLRFGAYQRTVSSGWHWHLPYPIENVYRVDTHKVRRASNRAVMLTENENFVDIEVSVQYRVSNALNFLFSVKDPEGTVEQVLRSAVREIVGTSSMNEVIQEGVKVGELQEKGLQNVDLKQNSKPAKESNPLAGISHKLVSKIKKKQNSTPQIAKRSRALLPSNVQKIMQAELSNYQAGVTVIAVNVQYAQPPEAVQGAFEEAIKAREVKERKKNLARADARNILAKVQGQKAQIVAKARGYQKREIQRAKGDASRFTQLLAAYRQAPNVTHERLYLQSMGQVLSNSHIILNNGGSSSMMYLPLQKLLGGGHQNKAAENAANNGMNNNNNGNATEPLAPDESGGNNSSANGAGGNNYESGSRSRSRKP